MNTPQVPATTAALVSNLRVTKKLATTNRGAIKLCRQFGDALVCVRHRVDAEARFRYTTVELLVARAEMQPRAEAMVDIRVDPRNHALRTVVRAAGGVCHRSTGLWRLPKRVVNILRLTHHIVAPKK
jgi:hypothetical protein